MSYIAVVAYPNEPDTEFNTDYYLKSHMPLVAKTWGPQGLKSWRVNKYEHDLAGATSKYLITATLIWESEEAAKKAVAGEGAPVIFGDIPNFTNKSPITLVGNELASQNI
ncbi:EthD domain-containing protein [Penicillium ucsense]|uniref:EthD domain-containing protein n=2 Tax=Penicillium TaxID=5073 RepID=A0A8J8WMB8_9EURO|nr:uncharacterized protein N7539_003911 [Penicillium diatomitis]KAF7720256.1 EthD domain-containing protein [Penicillium ucsense]KAF7739396.1 EthD domain-containing protein [Penicillium ucsense]KAJ5489021.1 hypothetical protein N7539_003911 [Penicillium diatomitis]